MVPQCHGAAGVHRPRVPGAAGRRGPNSRLSLVGAELRAAPPPPAPGRSGSAESRVRFSVDVGSHPGLSPNPVGPRVARSRWSRVCRSHHRGRALHPERPGQRRRRLFASSPGGCALGARRESEGREGIFPSRERGTGKPRPGPAPRPSDHVPPKRSRGAFPESAPGRPRNPGCTAARPPFQKRNTSKSDCPDRITDLQHFGGLMKGEAKHIYRNLARFCSDSGVPFLLN